MKSEDKIRKELEDEIAFLKEDAIHLQNAFNRLDFEYAEDIVTKISRSIQSVISLQDVLADDTKVLG